MYVYTHAHKGQHQMQLPNICNEMSESYQITVMPCSQAYHDCSMSVIDWLSKV